MVLIAAMYLFSTLDLLVEMQLETMFSSIGDVRVCRVQRRKCNHLLPQMLPRTNQNDVDVIWLGSSSDGGAVLGRYARR